MIMFMQLELVYPGIRHPDHVLTMYSSFLHMNYETKCINNYIYIYIYIYIYLPLYLSIFFSLFIYFQAIQEKTPVYLMRAAKSHFSSLTE